MSDAITLPAENVSCRRCGTSAVAYIQISETEIGCPCRLLGEFGPATSPEFAREWHDTPAGLVARADWDRAALPYPEWLREHPNPQVRALFGGAVPSRMPQSRLLDAFNRTV